MENILVDHTHKNSDNTYPVSINKFLLPAFTIEKEIFSPNIPEQMYEEDVEAAAREMSENNFMTILICGRSIFGTLGAILVACLLYNQR